MQPMRIEFKECEHTPGALCDDCLVVIRFYQAHAEGESAPAIADWCGKNDISPESGAVACLALAVAVFRQLHGFSESSFVTMARMIYAIDQRKAAD